MFGYPAVICVYVIMWRVKNRNNNFICKIENFNSLSSKCHPLSLDTEYTTET